MGTDRYRGHDRSGSGGSCLRLGGSRETDPRYLTPRTQKGNEGVHCPEAIVQYCCSLPVEELLHRLTAPSLRECTDHASIVAKRRSGAGRACMSASCTLHLPCMHVISEVCFRRSNLQCGTEHQQQQH